MIYVIIDLCIIFFCIVVKTLKRKKKLLKKKRKEKEKKHDKIVLLQKGNLNTIEVLISKALIDSYISHDKFLSVNNVLKKYNEIKKEIKNPKRL